MSAPVVLKQFGQYRTGTCVAYLTVRRALDVRVLTNGLSFKHGPRDARAWARGIKSLGLQDCKIGLLISIKDPYAWIASMQRFRPGRVWSAQRVKKACKNFNRTYHDWLCQDMPKYLVKYERLLTDLGGVVREIGDVFGLKVKREPRPIYNVVGPGERIVYRKFDPSYYLERKYMDELSPTTKAAVTDSINWKIYAPHGYHPMSA